MSKRREEETYEEIDEAGDREDRANWEGREREKKLHVPSLINIKNHQPITENNRQ